MEKLPDKISFKPQSSRRVNLKQRGRKHLSNVQDWTSAFNPVKHKFGFGNDGSHVEFCIGHDPGYRLYPIGMIVNGQEFTFSPSRHFRPTGNPHFPWELVPLKKPRHLREAIEAIEEWVAVYLGGRRALMH